MDKLIKESLATGYVLSLDKIGPKDTYHLEGTCLRHTLMVWSFVQKLGGSPLCELAAIWHDTGMHDGTNQHAIKSMINFNQWMDNYPGLGLSSSEVFDVEYLIKNHSILYWIKSDEDFHEKIKSVPSELVRDLLILTVADMLSCWTKDYEDQIKRINLIGEYITYLHPKDLQSMINQYRWDCSNAIGAVSQG